jgi:DNA-binding response OmpR family regulator
MMAPNQPPRILMFEDDDESMRGLQEYLVKQLGWQVDLAADIGLLERLARERYDLLLVDIMVHTQSKEEGGLVKNVEFPGLLWRKTGLEFLTRLRHGEYSGPDGTPSDVPVLILSAMAYSSIRNELGKDVHVQGLFEKPFILDELVTRMYELLQEKRHDSS